MTLGNEQRFMAGVVDGVDHCVESGVEDLGGGLFIKKLRDDHHFAFGMDGDCTVCHGLGLLAPDLAVHRVELAIDVGDANFVEIDHRDVADAGAGQ